jgi:hypothetical protein
LNYWSTAISTGPVKLLVRCRCTVLDAITWIIVESAEYMDV